MKSLTGLVTVALLATAAGAQPGLPPPPTPAPAPANGSAAAPATGSDDQGSAAGSGSDLNPSWLLGVKDVTAGEMATPGKLTLTMQRAVELAEKQHPTIRIARAAVEAAAGRVDSAAVPEHPTVTLSAGLDAGSTSVLCSQTTSTMMGSGNGSGISVNPNAFCPAFNSAAYSVPLAATARWTIYDFGLTHANVAAAQADADAAEATVASTALDVRLGVETAYLQAVAYRRLVIVAQNTVHSEEGHVDQAKRFVAAQAKDPIEVAQAEATLANAQSAEAQAESNEAEALAMLRAAIGWIDPTRQPAVDPNWPSPPDATPGDLTAYVETARKHRPDLVALDKDILAAQLSIDAAHAERRPALGAAASVGWTPNTYNWDPQPSWTAGLTLSWALWDGGKSAADVRVANANAISAEAQRDSLLVTLTSTIEQYRTQILTNKASVASSTEAVRAAQEELKLAEARYAQGLGSQIELADAETAVTTASGNLISAEWQLATAWANLIRAVASS
ncbi:MAG TPA: TolC family protein [Kofleriaceae bacterium]|jgi:outer membrane protein TolC